jgi:membrane fusion protein (multidrug efflux system)
MFSKVEVSRDLQENYITIPKAAVTFNPYGDLVYRVVKAGNDKSGKPILKVKQKFVNVGESRGDQISILSGVDEGDEIVTGGQLKLKNGSLVAINNAIQPSDNPNPPVTNDHTG